MKPHIYFQRYPSGLGFWKVSRTPRRWSTLSYPEKLDLQAAYVFVSRINENHDEEL